MLAIIAPTQNTPSMRLCADTPSLLCRRAIFRCCGRKLRQQMRDQMCATQRAPAVSIWRAGRLGESDREKLLDPSGAFSLGPRAKPLLRAWNGGWGSIYLPVLRRSAAMCAWGGCQAAPAACAGVCLLPAWHTPCALAALHARIPERGGDQENAPDGNCGGPHVVQRAVACRRRSQQLRHCRLRECRPSRCHQRLCRQEDARDSVGKRRPLARECVATEGDESVANSCYDAEARARRQPSALEKRRACRLQRRAFLAGNY